MLVNISYLAFISQEANGTSEDLTEKFNRLLCKIRETKDGKSQVMSNSLKPVLPLGLMDPAEEALSRTWRQELQKWVHLIGAAILER